MTTENRERAKRASPPERSAAVVQASDGVGGFAGAKPPELNDDVALLVRLAGRSDSSAPLDEDRLARVRTAVHEAWRAEIEKPRRRWLTAGVVFAAAAAVVIVVAIWRPVRTPAPVSVPVLVAQIDQATGSAAPFTAGSTVMSASTVTTSAGTLAMTLTSGVRLRMDTESTVRVDSATDVVLERGAVYVDSADGASPISVHTPAGLVRDVGTQFEVRLTGAGIRVRVRDGQVHLTQANGVDARADAGEELFARADGSDRSISRHAIAATGSEWAWAERAAPTFSIKGKTLGAFLDWVSREGAWTITFADSRFSAAGRAIVLDGRPDLLKGLTPAEALAVVLPTCGLHHRTDGQKVVIAREVK